MLEEKQTPTLKTSDIWYKVMAATKGRTVPGHPLSIDTEEFGIISQKGITETLMDILKADYSNTNGERTLTFDNENLENVRLPYDDIDVSITLEEETDKTGQSTSADSTDSAHVGGEVGDLGQENDVKNTTFGANGDNIHKGYTSNDENNGVAS